MSPFLKDRIFYYIRSRRALLCLLRNLLFSYKRGKPEIINISLSLPAKITRDVTEIKVVLNKTNPTSPEF